MRSTRKQDLARMAAILEAWAAQIADLQATADELKADLTLEQLQQLVGLVEYDEEGDVFPVTGWDAIVFVVGNATFNSLAIGSILVVAVAVLGNDTDPENDTLSVRAVTQGTKGAVAINGDGTVQYTPSSNANGSAWPIQPWSGERNSSCSCSATNRKAGAPGPPLRYL